MFVFKIDQQTKIVHVELAGIMSVSEAEKFTQELLVNASAARRQFGSFRLLIDARLAPVQPADTVSIFKRPSEVLNGDSDCYAVVSGSTLAKLQTNRIKNDDQVRIFSSMNEAESWLLAHGSSEDTEHGSAT